MNNLKKKRRHYPLRGSAVTLRYCVSATAPGQSCRRNHHCSGKVPSPLSPLLGLFASCLWFLAACSEIETIPETPLASETSGWPSTRSTDQGNFDVSIQPEGGEIERNKHFSLDVTVTAKNGENGDIQVVVDADMPAHQHGMNTKPEIFASGATKYRVEGMVFHMSGDWVITVDVTRGGKTERASFPVSVE